MTRPPVPVLLGADVGTTDSKVLVTTLEGLEVLTVSVPTVWDSHDGRQTDLPAERLAASVLGLLERAARDAGDRLGSVRVAGIGITGMGESGVLLDAGGRPLFPVLAWFDPRGTEEIAAFPAAVRAEFAGRTGLPLSPLPTLAKLAWFRAQGVDLAGKTWLNVAEYLVFRLGGEAAAEQSLLARTGLYDHDRDDLWPEALAAAGATPDLVPPRVLAGTPLGRAGDRHGPVPGVLHGAVLTVAGHDHPVAAVACGVLGPDELFDSFGTAEALVQTVAADLDLDAAARERLAGNGIETVLHVLDGRRALLGGTKAGLLLRRTLRLLGADHDEGRRALDDQVAAAARGIPAAGLEVGGAANQDGVLRIAATTDDVTPAALFRAVLEHAVGEAGRCLARMAAEVGPTGATVVAGGWIRMQSVREAKQASLPGVRFSTRGQAGAFGAALFAASAVDRAAAMTVTGDDTAVGLHHPTGPDPAFAAAFGGLRTPSAPTVRRTQRQEIPA